MTLGGDDWRLAEACDRKPLNLGGFSPGPFPPYVAVSATSWAFSLRKWGVMGAKIDLSCFFAVDGRAKTGQFFVMEKQSSPLKIRKFSTLKRPPRKTESQEESTKLVYTIKDGQIVASTAPIRFSRKRTSVSYGVKRKPSKNLFIGKLLKVAC